MDEAEKFHSSQNFTQIQIPSRLAYFPPLPIRYRSSRPGPTPPTPHASRRQLAFQETAPRATWTTTRLCHALAGNAAKWGSGQPFALAPHRGQ